MTEDKAIELINEWLELAKEVGDMNLNRMEFDEDRYNYAMNLCNESNRRDSRASRDIQPKNERVLTLSFFCVSK